MKFESYYGGSYFGKTSSSTWYSLCNQLNKATKELLWYWIVGISDYQIHNKVPDMEIQEEIAMCNDEVSRLCLANDAVRKPLGLNNKALNNTQADYKDKDLFLLTEGQIVNQNMDIGQIKCTTDLKTMLLRHWTLFDSISNSNYLVSKLEIHKEPGQKTFKKFLAQIGVSLDQAKQKYSYMKPDIRNNLK